MTVGSNYSKPAFSPALSPYSGLQKTGQMGALTQSLRISPYLLLILITLFWSGNFVLG